MKKELQEKLFEKYPELFVQKDWPMSETCMCQGVAVGTGWNHLIDKVCGYIDWHIKNSPYYYPQIQFTQVKQKFGFLRMYFTAIYPTKKEYKKLTKKKYLYFDMPKWKRWADKCLGTSFGYKRLIRDLQRGYYYLDGVIHFAEEMSTEICEVCGKPGKLRDSRWVECDKCYKKKNSKNARWGTKK